MKMKIKCWRNEEENEWRNVKVEMINEMKRRDEENVVGKK